MNKGKFFWKDDAANKTTVIGESSSKDDDQKIMALETEIESYKQALVEWNTWSQAKTEEYNQLLDAYNQELLWNIKF